MLEKIMNRKDFRRLVYLFGIILEIIGFGLLFSFDKAMSYIHQFPIIFSVVLIFTGYLLAVGVRR